jgi:plasmid stabilization system protein ParE
MIHTFHPEAATEYAEHVAFYESLRTGLGARFHAAVKAVVANACKTPARYRIEFPPTIRRARVQGFPYNVIFREVDGNIQVLAVAHHRRRPLYWLNRL